MKQLERISLPYSTVNNHIDAAIFITTDKIYQLSEVLENNEYMRWYGLGNIYFKAFAQEINRCGAFLEIDLRYKPQIFLRNINAELKEILKSAGHSLETGYPN